MPKHFILGVHITNRLTKAPLVQQLLSEYGCNIRTRLGLHDTGPDACSPNGLLILDMVGEEMTCRELATKLGVIEGIEVKEMIFDHPK